MRRIYLLVTFLLSLTVLLFEIAIIRLFSVVFFSNFAFISISVALFGVAIILFIIVFLQLNFTDSVFWLAVGIILAAFPFVLANIILTLLFKRFASQMSIVYFF